MTLSPTEIERYSRQLVLRDWTAERQLRLRGTTCLIDADFEFAARYLVAAGMGQTVICGNARGGFLEELQALNPDVEVTAAADFPAEESAIVVCKDDFSPSAGCKLFFGLSRQHLLHGRTTNLSKRILTEYERDNCGPLSQALLASILLTQYL